MDKMIKRIFGRAPTRVCDVGGWTDTWFSGSGAVFHIAVTPYVEVEIRVFDQRGPGARRIDLHLENYHDSYSIDPDRIAYDKHPLIEAALDSLLLPAGVDLDIDIFSAAPAGASVGTSAAVCVTLLGALAALNDQCPGPYEVAALAHRVETDKLGWQSGIQDQLCSAFGGINYIAMTAYPQAEVFQLCLPDRLRWDLENRLMLVYIGTPHNSSEVHQRVIADLGGHAGSDPRLLSLRQLAGQAREAVQNGQLQRLGEIMTESTEVQHALHPALVGEKSREIMDIARSYRAWGCKVNGAGGDGGSITILGDGRGQKKRELLADLEKRGYRSIPLALSPRGLQVWSEPANGA